MDKPLISIVVVNHNAGQLVVDCIDSLFKTQDYPIEVILVDSASSDNSHNECKKKFPQINLITRQDNVGYCLGNNIGIEETHGDFLVILNPDTKVEPDWLIELFKGYEKFGEALYQPKLLTLGNEDIFNSAGNMLHLFGFGYSRGKGEKNKGQFDKIEQIGYASGACLFTTKKIMEKIGRFDPFLYVYHDDLDLGWRAAQLGIKSFYIPDSIVYHAGSYNYKWSTFKFYLLEKNRHYCLLTRYSTKTFIKILPSLIIVEIFVLLFYLSKGMIKEKFHAYVTILRNLKLIRNKKKEIDSKKLISDNILIKSFPDSMFITNEIAGNLSIKIFNKVINNLSKFSKYFF